MKFVAKILASVAVASFAVAQPAAAATRSYESQPQSVDRAGSVSADADQLHGHGGPILGVLLIFGVLLAIFAVTGVFDNGKDAPRSP